MTVQLAVGMTAIRRDGARVGPVVSNPCNLYPFSISGVGYGYTAKGRYLISAGCESCVDLIAAGYPWTELGAQVGDTVRRVWCSFDKSADDWEFTLSSGYDDRSSSLYVIVKPAAKPADRPRAAHKLDLQDGDVVRLDWWQGDAPSPEWRVGVLFVVGSQEWQDFSPRNNPKGHRPLFTVISRAADAKPDEVIVRYGKSTHSVEPCAELTSWVKQNDTHRLTITFPHGSDTGTVTREKL